MKHFSIQSWSEVLKKSARGESLPLSKNASIMSMKARIESADYHLAEAVLQETENLDFLQAIKTHISRGSLVEARVLIQKALETIEVKHNEALRADLALEYARLEYQEGNWKESVEAVEHALLLDETNGLSKLTLLQIRSACFFEMQLWGKALSDIDKIRSLQKLYPKAISNFYSEALRVKILARLQGIASAKSELLALWDFIAKDSQLFQFDSILTLLRLEIDLKRLNHEPYASIAFATYLMAEKMGDSLYSALALLDLGFSEAEPYREMGKQYFPVIQEKFKKLSLFLNEIETKNPHSELTRNLLSYHPSSVTKTGSIPLNVSEILILGPQIRVDLKQHSLHSLIIQKKTQELLLLIQNPIKKEELFIKSWGLKYHPEKHDIIIRNALMRIRKQTGVQVLSQSGSIQTHPSSFLILL